MRGACLRGLLKPAKELDDHPLGLFYDLDAFRANMADLRQAFPSHWLHATAIKSNPLAATLKLALAAGHGAECASVGEVQHALRLGFAPGDIMYDSPCKTEPEIRFALERGVQLNIDNLQELERVRDALTGRRQAAQPDSSSVVGLRINPLVGAGGVGNLSVSTRKSKFGVVCPPVATGPSDAARMATSERLAVVKALVGAPFVTAVHVHVGSGSMSLEQMAEGAAHAEALASEVNELRRAQDAPPIDVIDIGGGLPVRSARPLCPPSPLLASSPRCLPRHLPRRCLVSPPLVLPRLASPHHFPRDLRDLP